MDGGRRARSTFKNPRVLKRVNPTGLTRRGFPHFRSEDLKHNVTLAVEIESSSPFEVRLREMQRNLWITSGVSTVLIALG